MHYTDRIYSTVLTTDLGSVDFSQVMETSANTVRKSIDETQFVLKWYIFYGIIIHIFGMK